MSKILDLHIKNFRNHESLYLEFDGKSTIIYGQNGVGKTNILEAISFLSPGNGIRDAEMGDIIKKDSTENFWMISANIQKTENISANITSYFERNNGNKRIIKIDNKIAKSQNNLINELSIIWMDIEMYHIFLQPQSKKRRFFDKIIYEIYPKHLKNLAEYKKQVKERLKILLNYNNDKWLDIIEARISEIAAEITFTRNNFTTQINKILMIDPSCSCEITIDGEAEDVFLYNTSAKFEEFYIKSLKKNRHLDKVTKKTNFGIHLSNFEAKFLVKNIMAKFASNGEQKMITTSIIKSIAILSLYIKKITPVILLDEVFSGLDQDNTNKLIDEFNKLSIQYFITNVTKNNIGDKNFIHIK